MSRNVNVNPGQYKTAGRERQGEDVVIELEKQKLTRARPRRRGMAAGRERGTGRGTRRARS